MGDVKEKCEADKGLTLLVHASCVERMAFGRDPVELICKNCGQRVVTEISRHNGVCSFFSVLVALFLCTPCAWVPLIAPTCKDTLHACPNCGATIGVHRYFK
ncbi:lipopolysaccharide-induced tumor necrosis factor-alpha factor homolog [Stegodyphus dumicola]|uniref:lipopolysaccharide-induced tumor necrosis factor-alpha factor homolog n=1 Tax=Stegodyphus dumicola TaxID=202533 RepID=UPI0015AC3C82|nr:lipopolysaccharide-induced tumor necrosis factor-alpha factor homolog [Stegodyphus dumicola]